MSRINNLKCSNLSFQKANNPLSLEQNTNTQLVSPTRLSTNAVYTSWQNPKLPALNADDKGLTLIHLNDNHRKIKGLAKFKSAIDAVIQNARIAHNSTLIAHAGDYNLDVDAKKLQLQIEILNKLGVNFAAIGNHDLEITPKVLANELIRSKFVSLVANLIIPEGHDLNKLRSSGKLASSCIYTTNGQKYGVIGLSPPNLRDTVPQNIDLEGIIALDDDQTIIATQKEVDKLKAQGINKIILISHVGVFLDRKIAEQTNGVDIILGGHSHTLLDPMVPGVSLYNSNAGEPVLIFQNGKNAMFLGVTDAYFTPDGIVKAAIARQENANSFISNPEINALENNFIGTSSKIGMSTSSYTALNVRYEENPIANFITDAIRAKTGAEISLFRGTGIRGDIEQGKITNDDIDEVLPFIDTEYLAKLSGKDIIEALSKGAKSLQRQDRRPGVLHASGLRYVISPTYEATNVTVLDKDGQYKPIDPNREYTVALNTFLLSGTSDFPSLSQPTSVIKAFYDTDTDIIKNAIKASPLPVTMKKDGRIQIQAAFDNDIPKALQTDLANSNTPRNFNIYA